MTANSKLMQSLQAKKTKSTTHIRGHKLLPNIFLQWSWLKDRHLEDLWIYFHACIAS